MLGSLRRRGLLYSAGVVFNRVVPERLFRFRITNVYRLKPYDQSQDSCSTPSPSLKFIACQNPDQFDQANRITGFESPSHRDADRLDAFLAVDDSGTAVGAIWSITPRFEEPELGLRYVLAANSKWWFAARVLPEHRGQGVYTQMLGAVLNQAPNVRHYVAINPTNRASMAAHRKFVSYPLLHFSTARLLGVAYCRFGTGNRLGHRWTSNARANPIRIDIESPDADAGKP
ncbi:MAG: GNAT family N-acetyltransferase [Planctomycetota bacterium]